MFSIHFFANSASICANDFKNETQVEYINLQHVSSLSGLMRFHLPFSGKYVSSYGVLSMQNGDKFCITEDEYYRIKEELKI